MGPGSSDHFVPVIILGAPRSGTNVLRDVLGSPASAVTWPCDEINYLWRHGNRAFPSDELPRVAATDSVRSFVRARFERLAGPGITHVIEKTCANCLRVPFVDAILPDARYIHIVRDGRDAALSIMKRWTGGAALGYVLRKARFVPPVDVPYYAWRYLRSRLARFARPDGAVGSWGPRFDGIDELLREGPLSRVCAEQWRRCVREAADALERLPAERSIRVRYESFVEAPELEAARIADFVGLPPPDGGWRAHTTGVHRDGVGRWKAEAQAIADLLPFLEPELQRLGYGGD